MYVNSRKIAGIEVCIVFPHYRSLMRESDGEHCYYGYTRMTYQNHNSYKRIIETATSDVELVSTRRIGSDVIQNMR